MSAFMTVDRDCTQSLIHYLMLQIVRIQIIVLSFRHMFLYSRIFPVQMLQVHAMRFVANHAANIGIVLRVDRRFLSDLIAPCIYRDELLWLCHLVLLVVRFHLFPILLLVFLSIFVLLVVGIVLCFLFLWLWILCLLFLFSLLHEFDVHRWQIVDQRVCQIRDALKYRIRVGFLDANFVQFGLDFLERFPMKSFTAFRMVGYRDMDGCVFCFREFRQDDVVRSDMMCEFNQTLTLHQIHCYLLWIIE
mmetsp:Transcript_63890/g.101685  ORF Transcript_63890/g.101685 Transcript_63890/m.101685 type:complete len:247 (+) Transcript_63890:223-963(+)